jgi:hypothetical protein
MRKAFQPAALKRDEDSSDRGQHGKQQSSSYARL